MAAAEPLTASRAEAGSSSSGLSSDGGGGGDGSLEVNSGRSRRTRGFQRTNPDAPKKLKNFLGSANCHYFGSLFAPRTERLESIISEDEERRIADIVEINIR